MTPHEVLSLCADLGLDVRAEEGNLYVSPAEKLPERGPARDTFSSLTRLAPQRPEAPGEAARHARPRARTRLDRHPPPRP